MTLCERRPRRQEEASRTHAPRTLQHTGQQRSHHYAIQNDPASIHSYFSSSIAHQYIGTTATNQLIPKLISPARIAHHLLNNQPHKQHQQLIKYSCDWLPTGHEVHQHNPLEDHRCPHCKTVFEKNDHLLQCMHPEGTAKWTQMFTTQATLPSRSTS
jgi:hypothetical protein